MTTIAPAKNALPTGDSNPGDRDVQFYTHHSHGWETYKDSSEPTEQDQQENAAKQERLTSFLLASMQMQNLLILAGSGTSYEIGGPSMRKLWLDCVGNRQDLGGVLATLNYGTKDHEENIEELLSRCDAALLVNPDNRAVADLRRASIETILTACRNLNPEINLHAHKDFLRRLARRRARDHRLKLFTTNYDLAFERAAGELGLVAIDGFSFALPRRFDPRFFEYDIVRRSPGSDTSAYAPGVFQYFKLHGSIDWKAEADGSASIDPQVDADRVCLIYPATTKFRLSFRQPHLELMSQYMQALRQPNTCLLVIGFGLNDDHLSEPILAALETNPHFRVIVADPFARSQLENGASGNAWLRLRDLARRGTDVAFVNVGFDRFVSLIPDLKALSPAEQLQRAIQSAVEAR